MSNENIRVLLADDHAMVREGLRLLLRTTPDITVIGEADNGVTAQAQAEQLSPHIVILNLDMPGGDGMGALKELQRSVPGRNGAHPIRELERAGADGPPDGGGGLQRGRGRPAAQHRTKTVDAYKRRVQDKLGLEHRTDYVRLRSRPRYWAGNPGYRLLVCP